MSEKLARSRVCAAMLGIDGRVQRSRTLPFVETVLRRSLIWRP
jgi:hypothetical protein